MIETARSSTTTAPPSHGERQQAAPRGRRAWIAAEVLLVFVIGPALLAVMNTRGLLFPAIWLLGLYAWVALRRSAGGDRRELVRLPRGSVWVSAGLTALAWVALAGSLLLALNPEALFGFPRRSPGVWLVVMIGYPLLSVPGQEIAFRSLVFARLEALLPGRLGAVVWAQAGLFAWAHIVMWNWWAVLFCMIGGVLIGRTYARHRSLPLAIAQHALYGCLMFTVGWGQYFVAGRFTGP